MYSEILQIEKDVPVPEKMRARMNGLAGVLRSMEVGDSFLWPKARRNSLAATMARLKPRVFTSRSVDDENVRVWRVE